MSVPKRRKTSSRKRKGQSHHALKTATLVKCSQCNKYTKPHQVCAFCGYYKGKEVVDQNFKLERKQRKEKERKENQA